MSTLRAYLGTAGLTDVGYRFYLRTSAVGARVTAGLLDEGEGWYSFPAVSFIGLAADHVRWDSTGTPAAVARVNITNEIALETILANSHTAADVWAASTRTLSSFGTLVADVATAVWAAATRTLTSAAGGATAAEVWAYVTRTLTGAGSVTVVSPVSISGGAITVRAGDSWSIPITGLGNITSNTKLWFAVNKAGAADSAAKLFLERTDGLTVVNSAAYGTAGHGVLTVDDGTLGNITLTFDEAATKLVSGSAQWAVKMLKSGSTTTLATGSFAIKKHAVSAIT